MKVDIVCVPLFLILVSWAPADLAPADLAPADLAPARPVRATKAPPPVSPVPGLQDAKRVFRDSFTKAMTIGAKDEMKRLVTKDTDQATYWIIETAEAIANAPNDTLFDRFNALRDAWKATIKTDFCDKMERYFSLMDPPIKRERVRMRGEYDKRVRAYIKNLEDKDIPSFTKLGIEFESLAGAFTEIADHYYAALCWSFVGNCFDEPNLGKRADLQRATAAYENFISSCDAIGLKDKLYRSTLPRLERLVALGFSKGGAVGGAPAAGEVTGPAGSTAAVIEASMTFEVIDDIGAIQRPNYFLDELYPMWNQFSLQSKGSQVPVPRLEEAPNVMRVGAAEARVDVDRDGSADGKGDVKIPLRGKIEPVVFEIGEGESKRQWALLTQVGIQKDSYQSIEMNLEPSDDFLNIYFLAAGSVVGTIDGTQIRVIDDNVDGIYGSAPSTWGHVGMSKGNFQPEMDSIVIGKSKRAEPWSEFVKIGDTWYRLEPTLGGMHLTASPVTVRTGFLKLKYKGPPLSYMVVKGANDFENSYWDISSGKPVEVPLGRYSLYFGMVSKGKKKQVMKALIVPGEDTGTWDLLKEGSEVTVELGAPFGFDFDADVDDREILVTGTSVVIVGKAGERYERVWGAVSRPSVSYRKAGSKRGTKPESMDRTLDQAQITEFGWPSAWFPRDLVMQRRGGAENIELQLTEKKNKLFGKIESVWK